MCYGYFAVLCSKLIPLGMSRVIVKNIPTKIDETKLRELFEQCGHVTDVKVQKCRNGRPRHFGFVGYHSEQEAEAAVKHFNKTFLNSVRIEVEIAKRYGDPSIPRPWSRYAKGSSAHIKLQKEQSQKEDRGVEKGSSVGVGTNKNLKEQQLNHEVHKSKLTKMLADYYELEKDPTFKEFVALHNKKDKRKTWNNEVTEPTDDEVSPNVKPKVVPHIESVEAKRPGGKGILLTRTHLKFEESESEPEELIYDADRSNESKAKLSDIEYLRSKVVRNLDKDHVTSTEDHVSTSESSDEEVEESGPKLTLKMRGLPFSATEQDIKDFFHPVNIKEIRLVQTAKGRPSGRAFVDFYNESDLKRSIKHHKEYMNNRYIELFVDEGPSVKKSGVTDEGIGLKQQQPMKCFELSSKGEDENLLDSGRLFVRNLPYSITEEDITKLFEKYGPLTEVTIPLDKEGSRPIGYAFVTFVFPEHAVRALEELDGSIFQGRLLHLMPSKDKDIGKIDGKHLRQGGFGV